MIKNAFAILFLVSSVLGRTSNSHYFTGSYAQEFSEYIAPLAKSKTSELQAMVNKVKPQAKLNNPVNITVLFRVVYTSSSQNSNEISFSGSSSSSSSTLPLTISREEWTSKKYTALFNKLDHTIARVLIQINKIIENGGNCSTIWDIDLVQNPSGVQEAFQNQSNRINAKLRAIENDKPQEMQLSIF